MFYKNLEKYEIKKLKEILNEMKNSMVCILMLLCFFFYGHSPRQWQTVFVCTHHNVAIKQIKSMTRIICV